MNHLQRSDSVGPFARVDGRRATTTDVIDAYFAGRPWQALLNEVADPQDLQAADALERVVDLARASKWANLQRGAEGLLRQFPSTSSGYIAARMVVSPTTTDILRAFDTDPKGTGDAKPRWERAIERLAAQGSRDAFDDLRMLLVLRLSRPSLTATVRRALSNMQDTADASMHADINRVLGTTVPYRKAGLSTLADGNCLIHALMGTASQNVYRCEPDTVRQVRQQLNSALVSHDPKQLPEPIAQVVRKFYMDLLEVIERVEGSDLPNREALENVARQLKEHLRPGVSFDQLAVGAQEAIFQACAFLIAQPNYNLSSELVPLLARVSKQAVSLYEEGRGWLHFDSDGQPCALKQDAVAICYNARRQHYGRVEGPLEDAVPDEPPAYRVPSFPVERRPRPVEVPTASLSTRTGSAASLLELEAKARASEPIRPRQDGLVARFFSWIGGFFG